MTLISERYQLGERIGAGAMGDVYKGVDTHTQQPVAIKVLKESLGGTEFVERFVREAHALRDLNHPNIVKLLAYAEQGQALVMEFVPGGDLRTLLSQHPDGLPVQQALNITLDLCDALTRAHRLNIIHRDLKPANILIAADGTPRLTDFGVARFAGQTELTEEGAVVGTFAYFSPEGILGLEIDERADIWALGIILVEMLTGRRPFEEESVGAMMNAILNSPLPDLKTWRADLDDDLLDLLYRMLTKSRDARIPSIRVVGAAVEAMLKGETGTVVLEPPTPVTTTRRNLPNQVTPFVGRQTELAELQRLIAERRLITVLGPGGMGKTRLSIEAAGRAAGFADGVYFVRLAPLTSAESIPVAVGEAYGLSFAETPTPAQQIVTMLANKHLLLVLDNFEHVIEGAGFVADMLTHAPGVTVLVTSRERLNLSAETVFGIAGMSFPDWETPEDAMTYSAVQLFMQSAQRVKVDFALTPDNLTPVARICRLVQGMPLGILLAAAWVDMLTPEEIAAEIEGSFDFLESDMRDLPARQQSMRAVFNYSWQLLNEGERDALMAMSVFRGGSSRKATQTVTGAGLRLLNALVNKSLVTREGHSGRYVLHELIRQYAAQALEGQGAAHATRDAHADYYLGWLAGLEADLKGQRQKGALDDIEADFENVRAAWLWAVEAGRDDLIRAALSALRLMLRFRGRYQEGVELITAARQRWSADSLLAGRLLLAYPEQLGDPPQVLQRAYDTITTHDDAIETARAANALGRYLAHNRIDDERGTALMEEARTTFKAAGLPFDEARVMDDLAFSYPMGEARTALVDASIALRREIGDKVGLGNALRNRGGTYQLMGDLTNAAKAWGEANAIAIEMGDLINEAWCQTLLTLLEMAEKGLDTDLTRLDRVRTIAKETNLPVVHALVDSATALRMTSHGEPGEALALAERLLHDFGVDPYFMSIASTVKAVALCRLGHAREAVAFLLGGLPPESYSAAFLIIAMAAAEVAPAEDAARWLGRAQRGDVVTSLYDRLPFLVAVRQRLREELGEEAFEEAQQEGLTMPMSTAIAEIRQQVNNEGAA